MLEPPSAALVQQLAELGLCGPGDWRRARTRVRQLTRDLPAFDSIWLDALTHLGRLTPFQAERIEAGTPEVLLQGDWLLIRELGHGDTSATYLARPVQPTRRSSISVLRRVSIAPEQAQEIRQRCDRWQRQVSDGVSSRVVIPTQISVEKQALITVSSYVAGTSLTELLVRRGRFPGMVVADIAAQLLEGLASLHARGVPHGDLRLNKVLLTTAGDIVLVDAGLQMLAQPTLLIHDRLMPEACDGMAPERIGTGQPPTAAADLYALGCLLWQLLAGRPPYMIADPLAKLAAHQTQTIVDVREYAPDSPAPLADLIRMMTASDPGSRPRTAEEALQRLGRSPHAGRSRLARFRQQFQHTVPHLSSAAVPLARAKWTTIAALLFAFSGAALFVADRTRGPESPLLMRITQWWPARQIATSPDEAINGGLTVAQAGSGESAAARARLPLPRHDADGVILLMEPGPYDVAEIQHAGPITLRAAPGVTPRIELRDPTRPLKIVAQAIRCEGVTFDARTLSAANFRRYLLLCQTQTLHFQQCRFEFSTGDAPGELPTAVAWKPLPRREATDGVLEFQDCAWLGEASSIHCVELPRVVRWNNCLKVGSGTAIQLAGGRGLTSAVQLTLRHVTLRDSGPCLALSGPSATRTGSSPVTVDATQSVFALSDATAGLVELQTGETLRADWRQAVQWSGEDSLFTGGDRLLARRRSGGEAETLTVEDTQFDGLTGDGFEFAGAATVRPADSALEKFDGPRRSRELPGIQPHPFSRGGQVVNAPGATANPR